MVSDQADHNQPSLENPFALGTDSDESNSLSASQHAVSLCVGFMTTVLIACTGIFCWWNGVVLFLRFYGRGSSDQPLTEQASIIELAAMAAIAVVILGFSAWLGFGAKNNLQRLFKRNAGLKQKRQLLSEQAEQMRRAVKENAKQSPLE